MCDKNVAVEVVNSLSYDAGVQGACKFASICKCGRSFQVVKYVQEFKKADSAPR